MRNRIYVDHAATTPLCDAALETMLPFLREDFGNPSSLHSWAREPREALAARFRDGVDSFFADAIYLGSGVAEQLPGFVSVSFPGHSAEGLI